MEYLRIGLILRPHGVRGAVKVLPLGDDSSRFLELEDAFLERGGSYAPVRVADVNVQDSDVYLSLSAASDRNDAEKLRNVYICVDRAHAAKLPEGRYFIADLIGCEVSDTDGRTFGKLTDVLQNGAADVYVVKGEKELMFPALKTLLNIVDISGKRIVLDARVLEEVGLFED